MNTHIPEEYGGPGPRLPLGLSDRGGARPGAAPASAPRSAPTASPAPRSRSAAPRRSRRSTSGMLTEAPKLASFCLTEPDAGSDVSGMKTTRRQEGRQVRHQRLQVLHHQRRLRRLVHRLRQDRPGRRPPRHLRLRRRQGRHGLGRQEGGQDGPAGLQHRDDHLQRHRGPRREPARRGEQGLQARDDDPRPHPPGRRRDGDGHRAAPRSSSPASTRRSASSSACRSRCTRRSSS